LSVFLGTIQRVSRSPRTRVYIKIQKYPVVGRYGRRVNFVNTTYISTRPCYEYYSVFCELREIPIRSIQCLAAARSYAFVVSSSSPGRIAAFPSPRKPRTTPIFDGHHAPRIGLWQNRGKVHAGAGVKIDGQTSQNVLFLIISNRQHMIVSRELTWRVTWKTYRIISCKCLTWNVFLAIKTTWVFGRQNSPFSW